MIMFLFLFFLRDGVNKNKMFFTYLKCMIFVFILMYYLGCIRIACYLLEGRCSNYISYIILLIIIFRHLVLCNFTNLHFIFPLCKLIGLIEETYFFYWHNCYIFELHITFLNVSIIKLARYYIILLYFIILIIISNLFYCHLQCHIILY